MCCRVLSNLESSISFVALRHRKFFSIAELNEAIAELVLKLDQRRFRKRDANRAETGDQIR